MQTIQDNYNISSALSAALKKDRDDDSLRVKLTEARTAERLAVAELEDHRKQHAPRPLKADAVRHH